MAKGRGGKREGAGRKPGTPNAATIEKALLREEMRGFIAKHIPRMLGAQIEAACGVAHLMIRNDDGTWAKAPAEITEEQMLAVLNGDPNRYYISTKDPNTQAFNTLAAYAADKPKEQEQEIVMDATLEIRWQS